MMKLLATSIAAAGLLAAPALVAQDWSYDGATGPERWGDLSREYEMCKLGRMQSPIDLAQTNARGDVSVHTDYVPGPLTVYNTGYTVQANFAQGSSLTSGTMQFPLVQVHFHTPSEEVIHGEAYPMVAHFVHADAQGRLAVLGVLFEEGEANDELAKIIAAVPRQASEPRTMGGVTFDPNGMLPHDLSVYRFQGSLTTPPCSEGVNWHVVRMPVSASAQQLAAMRQIMGENVRPVQPLNGRLVVGPE